jgi:hypothetical protein
MGGSIDSIGQKLYVYGHSHRQYRNKSIHRCDMRLQYIWIVTTMIMTKLPEWEKRQSITNPTMKKKWKMNPILFGDAGDACDAF